MSETPQKTPVPAPPPGPSASSGPSPGSAGDDLAPVVEGAPAIKQTERPHPVTPFIRGWIVLVAIVIGFGRELIPDGDGQGYTVDSLRWILPILAAMVVIAAVAGFVTWYFTRFVIDDEELRIETGAIFKNSKRISFERLQSVDIIQPMAARLFGLAELRLEVGAGDAAVKLRYLTRHNASQLRDYLLARAHGEHTTVAASRQQPAASAFTDLGSADKTLITVSPQRLVGALLLSSEWIISTVIVLAGWIVTAFFDVTLYALPGLIPLALGALSLISRRVIAQFNFTLAESARGLRITRGLTNLTSQSVPVDRIQGVRVSQSILWRRVGWYRVDVDVLGLDKTGDSDNNRSDATSVLVPVASLADVKLAMSRVLPGVDLDAIELHPSPKRARWIRPFDGWTLRYGWNDAVIMTEHGYLVHTRDIVPNAKSQSVRIEQGPLQRRLRLASVHVDTPKGPVNLVANHLEPHTARALALSQLDRARAARTAAETARLVRDPAALNEPLVLAHFGISGAQPIGSGGESRVFALDEDRVLRLYHGTHSGHAELVSQLQRLYGLWAQSSIGLEVPQILETGQIAGRTYTVDRRMTGTDFSSWLTNAAPEERRPALISYLDAAMSVQRLPLPYGAQFGRLIGADARPFASLSELLNDQLNRTLAVSYPQLSADVVDLDRVLDQLRFDLGQRVAPPALVHGDIFTGNAFIETSGETPRITGIGDFSPHTLAADPLMDVAGAIFFLELTPYAEVLDDAQWLTEIAVQRLGSEVSRWLEVYRRYFAVYYSMTVTDADPFVYNWCVAQLRTP